MSRFRAWVTARPVFWLALLWIALLSGLKAGGISLRRVSPGEDCLKEGALRGSLEGTLSEVSLNSLGQYSLLLSDTLFYPEGREEPLKAGSVLVYFPAHRELVPGPVLAFRGSLELFREADNPGEFDPRAYYLSRNIACHMDAEAMRVARPRRDLLREAAYRVRKALRESLTRLYGGGEAGILGAMLLGERSGVDEETEALYETAGLSHLLSVSGLHVSFWALILGKLAGGILSFFPFTRGRGFLSRRGFGLLKAFLSMAAVAFYMLLCGSRIPVQRAGLMALLYQLALGLGFSFDFASAWGAAVLAVLLPCPEALFQASFQLSFACVFLLGILLPLLSRKLLMERELGRALLVPVLIQMGTLPISLWHFFSFHPYSLPANLLAVPLAGLLLALSFGSAFFALFFEPGGRLLALPVSWLLGGIEGLCRLIRGLPFSSVITGRPAVWKILGYGGMALGVLALCFVIRRREVGSLSHQLKLGGKGALRLAFREARESSLLLLAGILAAAVIFFIPEQGGQLKLESLYVGQGDCHVLTLENGHSYLVDGGGGSESVGERIILPFLRCRGIKRLEYLIVSHPDSDHINGLEALMGAEDLQIRGLLLPAVFRESEKALPLIRAAEREGIPVHFVQAGTAWQDGDMSFSVLYPGGSTQVDDNESSLVLHARQEDFSLLFTGDLGELGEELLCRFYGEELPKARVLKVGHHGSASGSSEAFLKAVRPELALISCGRGNRYGHPAPETLERLQRAGAFILRTDESGALGLIWEEGELWTGTFHKKETDMMTDQKETKQKRTSLILSFLVLGAGAVAMILALILPGPQSRAPAETAIGGMPSGAATSIAGVFQPAETGRSTEAASEEESWPVSRPAGTAFSEEAAIALSLSSPEANGGRGGPVRDPQAEECFLDLELTDKLYRLLAGDLTNNTDPGDPFRCLSEEAKAEIDILSEEYVRGELSEEGLREALKGKSFVWPEDKLKLVHPFGDFEAHCYSLAGRDMEAARERILLSNMTPRHYLFLRIYYHPGQDRVRIYMVNGLIY